MRIAISEDDAHQTLRYELHLDPDDVARGVSRLRRADRRVALRERKFRVELGFPASLVHPDAHATALWLMVHPFLGRRLELPFGGSAHLAEVLARYAGVELVRVDPGLAPRVAPAAPPPALSFSGGADSTAASLLMPDETIHLFLDRIPRYFPDSPLDVLVAPVQQRRLCARLERDGRRVVRHRDDHEAIFDPYPYPHTNMTVLAALYRAETLGLGQVELGAVMADRWLRGYVFEDVEAWRFRRDEPGPREGGGEDGSGGSSPSGERRAAEDPDRARAEALRAVGLSVGSSSASLTEVGTRLVVHRSAYRGATYSCFQRSFQQVCLRCDKCFRKLLLDHVFEDREFPAGLAEHFLRQPHLRAIFSRPFFDFHDVWFYALQRVRCSHPILERLAAAARRGPDVAFLAKWYPRSAGPTPPYWETLRRRAERSVGIMGDAEVARLEALDLPPLGPLEAA